MISSASFPRLTLEEEFTEFLKDAILGTDLTQESLLEKFPQDIYDMDWNEENKQEIMELVCDQPFILNRYVDGLTK